MVVGGPHPPVLDHGPTGPAGVLFFFSSLRWKTRGRERHDTIQHLGTRDDKDEQHIHGEEEEYKYGLDVLDCRVSIEG